MFKGSKNPAEYDSTYTIVFNGIFDIKPFAKVVSKQADTIYIMNTLNTTLLYQPVANTGQPPNGEILMVKLQKGGISYAKLVQPVDFGGTKA